MNNMNQLLVIGIVLVVLYYIYEVLIDMNINLPELPIFKKENQETKESKETTNAIDLIPVPGNILAAKNPEVIKLTQI